MSQENLLTNERKVLVEASPEFQAWIREQERKAVIRKDEQSRKDRSLPLFSESVPLSSQGDDFSIREYKKLVNVVILLTLAGCLLFFGFVASYFTASTERSSSQKFRHPLSLRLYDSKTRDSSMFRRHLKPQAPPPIEDPGYYIPPWPKPLPPAPVLFEAPAPQNESPATAVPEGRLDI